MSSEENNRKSDFWQDVLSEKPKKEGLEYRKHVQAANELYQLNPRRVWAKIQVRRNERQVVGDTRWWRWSFQLSGGLAITLVAFGIWLTLRPPQAPTLEPLVYYDDTGLPTSIIDPVGIGKSSSGFINVDETQLELTMSPGSTIRGVSIGETLFLYLGSGSGKMQLDATQNTRLFLTTAGATFLITGTEWIIEVEKGVTHLAVLNGSIRLVNRTTLLEIQSLLPGAIYSIERNQSAKLLQQTDPAEIIKLWAESKTLVNAAKTQLKPKKKLVTIILKDSSQVSGTIVSESADKILLQTGPSETIEILKSEILSIQK